MKNEMTFQWRNRFLFPICCVFIQSLLVPPATQAQLCTGALITYIEAGNSANQSPNICGTFCHPPVLSTTEFTVTPPGCDPKVSTCNVSTSTAMEFPGNHQNFSVPGFSWATLILTDAADGFIGQCGTPFAAITQSLGTATFGGSFDCAGLESNPASATFKLKAITCFMIGCEAQTIGTIDLGAALDCTEPVPPVHGCGAGACGSSCFGPGGDDGADGGGDGERGGGSSAAGGGPGVNPAGGGPGARLRYQAGGAGSADLPAPADWPLGRGWSHDYALAIVQDLDASHVWLITEFATYREFTDGNADDLYETVAPSDEYRTLEKTASGWALTDLDGTVIEFNSTGQWLSTTDRNGNTKTATYSIGQLTMVDFPDGRSETFTYHPDGKLATITEVGVDGITSRSWSYTWSGDDLAWLDRPDGTAWRFEYLDPANPGFMTRMVLVGTDASERILGAWEYDTLGNVIRTWKGAATFEDVAAVGKWSFSFDDPQLPAETLITDPLGNTMTYFFGRDPASNKPRLEKTTGDCPACGLGPNSQLFYEDPANPLRRTREINGNGITTLFTYDANGGATSRIEAFNTDLERETTWTYDPTWPALIATVEQPAVEGFPNLRLTTTTYDVSGNPDTRTIEGFEDGAVFSYTTDFDYNAGGQFTTIDPPGFGTADQTSFSYDPSRGNGLLVLESRTDPIIGTTTFGYDAFNRRTSVTDVNGVVSETQYDARDRVTLVIQRGASVAEDLVTEYRYDVFGGLFQIVLPEGNVVEYSYDSVGRLATVERKPDDQPTSHGERTVYSYDGVGNRVLEAQEIWDDGMWVKRSQTETVYTTRCQADRIIRGFGGEEVVTEFAYDCEGNLERVWDANHPSAGQTVPATSEYVYDELNRLTELRQPFGGAPGGTSVTAYGYDVQDHLGQITDVEGTVTTLIYSDRDLLTEEISEVAGTTTYGYNEHGELTTRSDARGITETRTVDELDRITFVDYPEDTLDIIYSYDEPSVPLSLGRLTRIERDGHAVAYTYDRFGRVLQDGDLLYDYDKNGNRTEVQYPGGVIAQTSYDFADRQATLTVSRPGEPDQEVVTAAAYEPAGPLVSLTLGNGLTETRGFDTRYQPASIVVDNAGVPELDWQYSTDAEGNITAILDSLNAANHRTYAYQDDQYFLIQGDGPWGDLAWTYDPVGNRLTEIRDGVMDTYSYVPNASGGNSAQLQEIQFGAGGSQVYDYDAVGNQIQVDNAGDVTERTYDDAGRMAEQKQPSVLAATEFVYDGRSLLRRATGLEAVMPDVGVFCDGFESGDTSAWKMGGNGGLCFKSSVVEPIYSAEARLHGMDSGNAMRYVFYFGDRPVAQLGGPKESLLFLTTDHLGTPASVSDLSGVVFWTGGLEPFGRDYSAVGQVGVFIRFPGQWEDASWVKSSADTIYYNAHRWYGEGVGRYTKVDPEWSENVLVDAPGPLPQAFGYANQQPLGRTDELGLMDIIPTVSPKCRKEFPDETSFKDFLQEVERAAKRSRDALPCKSNPGRPKKVKIKCGSCLGHCGYSGLLGGMCVNIGQNLRGQCGQGKCLGSTVFHEFIHQCGGDQAMAFGCEKLFYGDECRFTIPENFDQCPNPCKE